MATTIKSRRSILKSGGPKRHRNASAAKASRRTAAISKQEALKLKKISNTLDLPALLTHHKQNTSSATHWETEE